MAEPAEPTNDQKESKLLALPPELVEKIIPFVTDEALIPLRLTCKTLHDLSFNHFTRVYFSNLYCCMSEMDRYERLLNIIEGSSRIKDRIRDVIFTSDILELGPPLHTVKKDQQNDHSATIEAQSALYGDTFAVDVLFVNSVLLDLKKLSKVRIWLDFTGISPDAHRLQHCEVFTQFWFCLTTTDADLYCLNITGKDLPSLDYVLHYYRTSVMSLMSKIKMIKYIPKSMPDLQEALDIFPAATSVEELILQVGGPCRCRDDDSDMYVRVELHPALLLAINYSSVVSLKILYATLDDDPEALSSALEKCSPTLKFLRLAYVTIGTSNGGWTEIFRTLLTMPNLTFLGLDSLERHLPASGSAPPRIQGLCFLTKNIPIQIVLSTGGRL
ncbi:hypothetical protein Q7P37_008180 [Cladosporium fusiforme]